MLRCARGSAYLAHRKADEEGMSARRGDKLACARPCPAGASPPRDGLRVAEGRPIGYECRPCGTQIRWTPADVLNLIHREVRRHYAQYWARYREAISGRKVR